MIESELRAALDAITMGERDTTKHPALVAALRAHSIRHVPQSDARGPCFSDYNCFAFAFNLAESHRYRVIAGRFSAIHADPAFAKFLIANHILVEASPETAGVVIYFEGAVPKHAGKISAARVLSKWGVGELWDHGVHEVPAQYGDEVQFYAELPHEISEAAFIRYAERRGVVRPEGLPGWHAS